MPSNNIPSPNGLAPVPESLQAPKQSFFSRLCRPTTDSGAAYSVLNSPSRATPTADALTSQIDKLYLRCEELTMQSQLNQEMFEQSRQDAHEKDLQVQVLQAIKTELQATIDQQQIRIQAIESETNGDGSNPQVLANNHRQPQVSGASLTDNAGVVCQNCSNMNGKSENSGYGSLDEKVESEDDGIDLVNLFKTNESLRQLETTAKQCRVLDLENWSLATQLAKANAIAQEKDELIAKLKGQYHELINLYAEEQQNDS